MIYGIEIWGITGDGDLHNTQGTFCKKVLRLPAMAVSEAAEYELVKESRRGEIFVK
jgi:hypothetical protein